MNSHHEVRSKYIEDFKESVYGFDWKELNNKEIYFNPENQFVSGILFPLENIEEIEIEESIVEESFNDLVDLEEPNNPHSRSSEEQSNSNDEGDEDEDLNLINLASKSKQSAFGITFICPLNEKIKITYGFSTYFRNKRVDKDKEDKRPYSWTRNQFIETATIEPDIENSPQVILKDSIKINIHSRKIKNEIISTVSLCNLSNEILFHCGIEIEAQDSGLLPVKSYLQSAGNEEADSLELLFRKKLSFANGQGCATDWDQEGGKCYKVWTDFIPTYEVKSIDAAEGAYGMDRLSDIDNQHSDDSRIQPLLNLSNEYKEWLNQKRNEINGLEANHKKTAEKHFDRAERYLKRIQTGIELIQNDEEVSKVFRLTNYAMAIQFNRFSKLNSKKPNEELKGDKTDQEIIDCLREGKMSNLEANWRPFQLAFILASLPEIVDPEKYKDERKEVDLIWFPTGGGKTEAYLGLLAFTILHRRNLDPDDAGVTSIMRYTLRLLTADQFKRSAALICALEFIRRDKTLSINLGSEEISLGLWIGGEASPKTHQVAHSWMTKEIYFDKNKHYRFVLHECPWCKSNLTNPEYNGYVWRQRKVQIKCSDANCTFSNSIPVVLWEEAVYETKPSLVLATVDNFAKLVWEEKALETFSNEKYSPPDLIIQDELHLISGPLGSLVGLYENVVLKLLSFKGKIPKIIGASATLTFSDSQTKSLYRGRKSNVFPPQILDWGDTFFAKESADKPGRIYMGFFGSSRGSMVESSKKAVTPLLQSAQQNLPVLTKKAIKNSNHIIVNTTGPLEKDTKFTILHQNAERCEYIVKDIKELNEGFEVLLNKPLIDDIELGQKDDAIQYIEIEENNYRDPYGTLIWYFNSKRELASESNQINRLGDILRNDTTSINYEKLGTKTRPGRFVRRISEFRELTGRLSQDEIQNIVKDLNVPWRQYDNADIYFRGIDILFATNMISVGIDIKRLGLMAIHGQPRTTAEYIQATSRVGRTHPGLVVTMYNHLKSKDRSVYESFKNYHQSFYRFVESVSVTPFSSGARKKALAAIFIALVRAEGKNDPSLIQDDMKKLTSAQDWILEGVQAVDPEEYEATKRELEKIASEWKRRQPEEWGKMGGRSNDRVRLLGTNSSSSSDLKIFSAPISLRSSDLQVQTKLYDPALEENYD